MRRILLLLVASVLALTGLAAVVSPAQASAPLTGRVVDAITGDPVGGATVRLRALDGGDPGAVVDTATTASDGTFSLDAGPAPDDEYYVQLVAGRHQAGYAGNHAIEARSDNARTWGAGDHLGNLRALPAYIRGRVVDSSTKKPLRGVKVTARSANDPSQVEGADTTGRDGSFVITGLECEDDCYLKLNGSAVGHQTGFRACNAHVVATFDDACASPIGAIGKVFLHHS